MKLRFFHTQLIAGEPVEEGCTVLGNPKIVGVCHLKESAVGGLTSEASWVEKGVRLCPELLVLGRALVPRGEEGEEVGGEAEAADGRARKHNFLRSVLPLVA